MNLGIFYLSFKQLIRKPLYLLLLFAPIGSALIWGYFFEKGQSDLAVPIAIVDKDETEFSRAIVERIIDQPRIQLHFVSSDEAERLLLRNEVDSVFVIKKGFQEHLMVEKRKETIEVWVTPSSVAEGIVREIIASEVLRLTSNIKSAERVVAIIKKMDKEADSFDQIWQEAYAYTDNQWKPEPLMTIQYEQLSVEEPVLKPDESSNNSHYLALWTFFAMLVCFLTVDWVVREKRILFSRIGSTYKGLSSYIIQRSGAMMVIHILQVIISFLFLEKLVGMSLVGLIMMLYYILICFTISLWVASFIDRLSSYYIVSFLIVLVMGILGGGFIAIREFSPFLANLSLVLPQSLILQSESIGVGIRTVGYACFLILLWVLSIRRLRITQ